MSRIASRSASVNLTTISACTLADRGLVCRPINIVIAIDWQSVEYYVSAMTWTPIRLPIKTVSEPNTRSHWAARARRVKEQRLLVRATLHGHGCTPHDGLSGTITLTRIAPRLLDTDNLAGALKAVRDGVADALGIDDGSPRVTWRVEQERGAAKEYAVRISLDVTRSP